MLLLVFVPLLLPHPNQVLCLLPPIVEEPLLRLMWSPLQNWGIDQEIVSRIDGVAVVVICDVACMDGLQQYCRL